MNYRNEQHQIAFNEAISRMDKQSNSLMASIYLLTADYRLWNMAGRCVKKNEILFDKMNLCNITEYAYACVRTAASYTFNLYRFE